jgi:hypothetical protein
MAFSALAAMALMLAAGMAQAAMFRWVDGNGRVHYSDTPPTTYQRSGGAELSKQGNVIKRTQSEAERQAEAARQAELKRQQIEQQKQAQLDRALTQTYTSEAEIDLARDRALEHHKLIIRSAEIRAEAVNATLTELRERIARVEKLGRKVGPGLTDPLDQATRESLELKRVILNNEDAMLKVRDKYLADKLRFRELTASAP